MRVQNLGAVIGLAVLVTVSACASDDKPWGSRPETPSGAVRETADPTVDRQVDSAEAKTPEALIEAWIDARTHLQNTGDDATLKALSTRLCAYCTSFAREVTAVYAAGGRAEFPEAEVRSVTKEVIDGTPYHLAVVAFEPGALYEDAAAEVRRFPGGSTTYLFEVLQEGDGWLVDSVVRVDS